jgi:hypothetical protein
MNLGLLWQDHDMGVILASFQLPKAGAHHNPRVEAMLLKRAITQTATHMKDCILGAGGPAATAVTGLGKAR